MAQVYHTASDEELFLLLKASNQIAYAAIYDRYFDLLFRHAFSMLKDEDAALDTIQDVFTVLWERRSHIVVQSSLSAYLYTITRNGVLKTVRHSKVVDRFVAAVSQLDEQHVAASDQLIREKELRNIIEAEIERLPARMKEIFRMSRYEHLSHREIAERLGLSEHTVKRQISNAIATLRKKIGKWFVLSIFFEII